MSEDAPDDKGMQKVALRQAEKLVSSFRVEVASFIPTSAASPLRA